MAQHATEAHVIPFMQEIQVTTLCQKAPVDCCSGTPNGLSLNIIWREVL
jgi:hypothetical protein